MNVVLYSTCGSYYNSHHIKQNAYLPHYQQFNTEILLHAFRRRRKKTIEIEKHTHRFVRKFVPPPLNINLS